MIKVEEASFADIVQFTGILVADNGNHHKQFVLSGLGKSSQWAVHYGVDCVVVGRLHPDDATLLKASSDTRKPQT